VAGPRLVHGRCSRRCDPTGLGAAAELAADVRRPPARNAESVPFAPGLRGVEIGLLVETYDRLGWTRSRRVKPGCAAQTATGLAELGPMSSQVVCDAAFRRCRPIPDSGREFSTQFFVDRRRVYAAPLVCQTGRPAADMK